MAALTIDTDKLTGTALAEAPFTITLRDGPGKTASGIVPLQVETGATDASGQAAVELIPSSDFDPSGAVYRIEFTTSYASVYEFVMPSAASDLHAIAEPLGTIASPGLPSQPHSHDPPTKAEVYAQTKQIIQAGANISVTNDDDAETQTIAATGGGGGNAASESGEDDAKTGADSSAANATRMTPRRTKQAIDEQVDPETVQRKVFDGYYTGANYSALDHQAFRARNNGAYIAANTDWTNTNIDEIDLSDVTAFYQGITDTNDTKFDNQFVTDGPDISDKLDEIEVGGNIRINTLTFTNGAWVAGGGLVAEISGVVEIAGGYRLSLSRIDVVGSINGGDNIRVGIDPTADYVLWPHVLLAPEFVLADGSNVTDEFREKVQGRNEDEDLGTFQRVALGLEQLADNRFSVNAGAKAITFSVAADANYQQDTSSTNDAKIHRAAIERAWVRFGNGWEVEITSELVGRSIASGRAQYLLNYEVLAGTPVGLNSNTSVDIIGEDVHRGQLAAVAFSGDAADVSVDASGFDGNLATTDDDVQKVAQKLDDLDIGDSLSKEDTIPFAASFRDKFTRTFVASATANHGEALVSTGNTPPSGQPSDVTVFIGVEVNDSSGTSQATELAKISAGDWIRAKRGDNYIIARIAHAEVDTAGAVDVYTFWIDPDTAEDHTLSYDQLGTGVGEIRFYTRPSAPKRSATLTVTSSWQNIATGYEDDDLLSVETEGAYSSEASNIARAGFTDQFSLISTSQRWVGIRANANGARIEVRRNGTAVQARTQGDTANTKAYVVKLGKVTT